jgi:hypothetical protein
MWNNAVSQIHYFTVPKKLGPTPDNFEKTLSIQFRGFPVLFKEVIRGLAWVNMAQYYDYRDDSIDMETLDNFISPKTMLIYFDMLVSAVKNMFLLRSLFGPFWKDVSTCISKYFPGLIVLEVIRRTPLCYAWNPAAVIFAANGLFMKPHHFSQEPWIVRRVSNIDTESYVDYNFISYDVHPSVDDQAALIIKIAHKVDGIDQLREPNYYRLLFSSVT